MMLYYWSMLVKLLLNPPWEHLKHTGAVHTKNHNYYDNQNDNSKEIYNNYNDNYSKIKIIL